MLLSGRIRLSAIKRAREGSFYDRMNFVAEWTPGGWVDPPKGTTYERKQNH